MLRSLIGSAIRTAVLGRNIMVAAAPFNQRAFSSLFTISKSLASLAAPQLTFAANPHTILATPALTHVRTVTKFSLKKGKRKSVKGVLKRFKRLDWGMWIRTHSGRHKKLFKKSAARKRRLRQHIFTNASQSWKLDKMVTRYWRRPKYYIDDPYEPYHRRDEYFATKAKVFKV